MRWQRTRCLGFLAFAALGVLGCARSQEGPKEQGEVLGMDWKKAAALTAATSCEQAEAWLEDAVITEMTLHVEANRRCLLEPDDCGWYRGFGPEAGAEDQAAPTAGGAPKDDATPDEYSGTNLQVEGVDEADRVKTDGEHIYLLSGRNLVVVKTWPAAETRELGRVALRGWPSSFFLDGDKAVVLGSENLYELVPDAPCRYQGDDGYGKPMPADEGVATDGGAAAPVGTGGSTDGEKPYCYDYRPVTTVAVVSLADKANPRVVKEYFFDGYAMDARRIGSKVYLAQNNYQYFYDLEYWPPELTWYGPGGEETTPTPEEINAAFDAMMARNIEKIRARTLEEWLPRYWVVEDGEVHWANGQMVGSCNDIHAPSVFSGVGLLSLLSLDAETGGLEASTIQGSWGTVYASLDAVYVGTTNWGFYWWWKGEEEPPPVMTHIHKFAFDADGNARYRASGEVLGYAINQFAFDEYEGHLRVATTDGFGWWNNDQTESRVTVLTEEGNRLKVVGVVAGLGKGERIYAVRFIGDQGYVVTFRQVDPLYVLDLRDPTAPKVAGELKVPGFSSYIHPLEPGYLLTAGRDADEEGSVGGVKIEVFDVTDPANPKSVQSQVIGDGWSTWSDALWDHKAFTFFQARNLLAIPVSGWVETWDESGWTGHFKSELALFRVTKEAIEVLPSISHMGFFEAYGGHDHCHAYPDYWQAQIYRGVFIEDYVYSLSHLGMQVHDTRDLGAGPVAALTILDPSEFPPFDWGWCEAGEPEAGKDEPEEVPPADGETPSEGPSDAGRAP